MRDEQRIHRASLAKSILDNEVFIDGLNALEDAYTEAWKRAKTAEAREDAHRYVTLCARFAADLKAILFDGDMTQRRIRELEGKRRPW